MTQRTFENDTLEEFAEAMKVDGPLDCGDFMGVIDENGQLRPFTPKEEKQLGIVEAGFIGQEPPKGPVVMKPYGRPGSPLRISYGR